MQYARRSLMIRFLTLTAGLLMSGCGQKGPLYLPEEPKQVEEKNKEKEKGSK